MPHLPIAKLVPSDFWGCASSIERDALLSDTADYGSEGGLSCEGTSSGASRAYEFVLPGTRARLLQRALLLKLLGPGYAIVSGREPEQHKLREDEI